MNNTVQPIPGQTGFRYIDNSPRQIGLTTDQLKGLNQKYVGMISSMISSPNTAAPLGVTPMKETTIATPVQTVAEPVTQAEPNMFDVNPTAPVIPNLPETSANVFNTSVQPTASVDNANIFDSTMAAPDLTNSQILETVNPSEALVAAPTSMAQVPSAPVVNEQQTGVNGETIMAEYADIMNNVISMMTKMQEFTGKISDYIKTKENTEAPQTQPNFDNVFDTNQTMHM